MAYRACRTASVATRIRRSCACASTDVVSARSAACATASTVSTQSPRSLRVGPDEAHSFRLAAGSAGAHESLLSSPMRASAGVWGYVSTQRWHPRCTLLVGRSGYARGVCLRTGSDGVHTALTVSNSAAAQRPRAGVRSRGFPGLLALCHLAPFAPSRFPARRCPA